MLAPGGRDSRAEPIDGSWRGLGASRSRRARLHRQDVGKRSVEVRERSAMFAGEEQQSATLDADEVGEVVQRAVTARKLLRVHVAQHDHVVAEEFLAGRECVHAERGAVGPLPPLRGVEKDDLDLDPLPARPTARTRARAAPSRSGSRTAGNPRRRGRALASSRSRESSARAGCWWHRSRPPRWGRRGRTSSRRLRAGVWETVIGTRLPARSGVTVTRPRSMSCPPTFSERTTGTGSPGTRPCAASRASNTSRSPTVIVSSACRSVRIEVGRFPRVADADEEERHACARRFARRLRQVVARGRDAVGEHDDGGERTAAERLEHFLDAFPQPRLVPERSPPPEPLSPFSRMISSSSRRRPSSTSRACSSVPTGRMPASTA